MATHDPNTPKHKGRQASDLRTQHFGCLLPLERTTLPGVPVRWLCLCDPEKGGCGSKKDYERTSLTSGTTLSCGCRKSVNISTSLLAKSMDISGARYGALTVEHKVFDKKNALWHCRCDCGETAVARQASLLNGDMLFCSRTCPCRGERTVRLPTELLGKTFGKLEVIGRLPRPKGERRPALWGCRCLLCGRTTKATGNALKKGRKGSCGCAKHKRVVVRSDEVRKKTTAYHVNRYRTDPVFCIEMRIRAQLRFHMLRNGTSKTRRLEDQLGYSMKELHEHLMETMPDGSDWRDFLAGKLEIDHVVGLENFEYTSESDPVFREAWALSNLQLLTHEDHKLKSAAATRARWG